MIYVMLVKGNHTPDHANTIQVWPFEDKHSAVKFCDQCNSFGRSLEHRNWAFARIIKLKEEYNLKDKMDFEELALLDDRSIQKMMREIDSQELAISLQNAEEGIQKRIFRNMSRRAACMLKEDMDYMGPVPDQRIMEARRKIIKVYFRLIELGEIMPIETALQLNTNALEKLLAAEQARAKFEADELAKGTMYVHRNNMHYGDNVECPKCKRDVEMGESKCECGHEFIWEDDCWNVMSGVAYVKGSKTCTQCGNKIDQKKHVYCPSCGSALRWDKEDFDESELIKD